MRPLLLLLLGAAVGCGPSYFVVYEEDQRESAESLSLEIPDYRHIARNFASSFQGNELHGQLFGDPSTDKTPGIALLEFRLDSDDRASSVDRVESALLNELQAIGIRYVDTSSKDLVLRQLGEQADDLYDPATRTKFGKFANVHFLLKGQLDIQSTLVTRSKRKREFDLTLEVLELETLVVKFSQKLYFTKYME